MPPVPGSPDSDKDGFDIDMVRKEAADTCRGDRGATSDVDGDGGFEVPRERGDDSPVLVDSSGVPPPVESPSTGALGTASENAGDPNTAKASSRSLLRTRDTVVKLDSRSVVSARRPSASSSAATCVLSCSSCSERRSSSNSTNSLAVDSCGRHSFATKCQ